MDTSRTLTPDDGAFFRSLPTLSDEAAVRSTLANACAADSPHRFQLGVTVHFFQWLRRLVESNGEQISQDITTEQLVWGQDNRGTTGPSSIKWCIADQCATDKQSFAAWCVANGHTHDDAGNLLFGPVTTFASHAWMGRFSQFVDTLEQHAAEMDVQAAFFVDIFTINQHLPPWHESPPLQPNMVLQPPIEMCRSTLLVLTPFDMPIPLERSWCIYEISTTIALGATLTVGIPSDEKQRFAAALASGGFDFNAWVKNIDIEKAEAFSTEDRDMIMGLVRRGCGVINLNRLVVSELSNWLGQQGLSALQSLPRKERAPSTLIETVADMLWRQGKPDQASPLLQEMVEGRRQLLGSKHECTLAAVHLSAKFARTRSELEAAERLFAEAVQGRTETLGAEHSETLNSERELAVVRSCRGRSDEATAQLRVVVQSRLQLCHATEEKAAQVAEELRLGQIDELPEDGLWLARTTANVSREKANLHRVECLEDKYALAESMLGLQGTRQEAAALVEEVIDGRTKHLGEHHPRTLDARILRGQINSANPDDDAVADMRSVLDRLQRMLGARVHKEGKGQHYKVLRCLRTLAAMLDARGQFEEARQLAEEAAQGLRDSCGDVHHDTTTALELLALITLHGEATEAEPAKKKVNSETELTIDGMTEAEYWDQPGMELARKYVCFNGAAMVVLADGTLKRADAIAVGDQLMAAPQRACPAGPQSSRTTVVARCVQAGASRTLVKIGRLLISTMHRIQCDGRWIERAAHPQARLVHNGTRLHNFIVDGRAAIVVEGVVVSTPPHDLDRQELFLGPKKCFMS
jgi:hypothetical protein